jgi:hypothetical protein
MFPCFGYVVCFEGKLESETTIWRSELLCRKIQEISLDKLKLDMRTPFQSSETFIVVFDYWAFTS